MTDLVLREIEDGDLPLLFAFQLDPEANRMAAFTPRDPADRAAFVAHWAKIRRDPTILMRTIVDEGRVAGSVGSVVLDGKRQVTYWLGREFWGRGVATRALRALLEIDATRPIHASAAADNLASLRVLEKCGFRVVGRGRGFANARGEEIDEVFLQLG